MQPVAQPPVGCQRGRRDAEDLLATQSLDAKRLLQLAPSVFQSRTNVETHGAAKRLAQWVGLNQTAGLGTFARRG